ncbi:MAG: hypothetical protein A2018_07620 [Alphaproteobacteria bacterium GWF2_58_20]|nr:MAG: hypothetical protein A2018_07620 [Alphaproteobacteria bacterium GWF2_58_20]
MMAVAWPAHAQWGSLGGMMGSGGRQETGETGREDGTLAARPAFDLSASLTPEQLGPFRILSIGIDAYTSVPRLANAGNDARAVARQLEKDYGFETRLLTDPGRQEMMTALRKFSASAGASDNLVIYYAGHGIRDHGGGYWLPRDSHADSPESWISISDITALLEQSAARKILVISDSCYAGTMTRTVKDDPADISGILGQKLRQRSRIALTSGGLEPVSDGRGGHSVFASALLETLGQQGRGPLTGTQLYLSATGRMDTAGQEPEYANIPAAGHDGGDFIFLRR